MMRLPVVALALFTAIALCLPSAKAKNVTVEEHIEFIDAVYDYAGLLAIGLKRNIFKSCRGCVPFILYCTRPFKRKSSLRNKKFAARGASAKFVKKYARTVPQLLPMSEFKQAFQKGIIDCAATGGDKPKWAINGPRPRSLKNVKLEKNKRWTNEPSRTPKNPIAPLAPVQPADDLKSLDDF